ncbi:uncharacterized protein LOC132733177 [Ruditapes philippinarum]|uniref:uncharacterized protein LOC132733177 n=1 Tax=Ruditapes philippinarum TaxID=129788 RepID=UPI00295C2C28|nr:uncharacterized protein LOC132733177 [Ruditapes philippinarum]
MEMIYCVILLLHMFVLQVLPSEIIYSKWKRRKEECKLLHDYVTDQQQIQNLNRCIVACEMQHDCETVSWQIGGNLCLFSNKNVVDDKRQAYLKWEHSDGWSTYSKVHYPVSRVMNPEPDSDMMNYEEAVQACADQGSTIATPSDLEDARNAGMDTCACGWLSSGDNGGIVSLSGSCDLFNSTSGIEYCGNPRAIAWCQLN